MRSTRIITALVAVFTAALLGFTSTTPSNAGVATKAAAKPLHQINNFSAGETSTDGVFYAKGLAYTAKGQRVYLQNVTRSRSTWRTYKSMVTPSDTGRFVLKFRGPCGSKWRIVIREDRQQRTTTQFTYGDTVLHTYFGKITC